MEDFGLLVGIYNASLPTLTDTQLSELQLDSLGRLIISGRYLEDSAHVSGDAGISVFAVRNDAAGSLVSTDGDYSPLQVDANGRLRVDAEVSIASGADKAEDSAHASGDIGSYTLGVRSDTRPTNANTSADGDYASLFINVNGELYVHDTDALVKLTEIDTVLDSIKVDTGSIDTSIGNIETDIDNLTHVEDTAHVSGDSGTMPLAVRNDAGGSLVSADGDYAPLQVDSEGRLVTSAVQTPVGAEQYTVTDALAAAGDGLETITALATPWVTVASYSHTSGTAYLYGYQWTCDKNAQMRIVTDDTSDIIVYKTDINSSAVPGTSESWSDGARIEIPGSANLEIKLQIKKRSSTHGDANGSGSMHIRTV